MTLFFYFMYIYYLTLFWVSLFVPLLNLQTNFSKRSGTTNINCQKSVVQHYVHNLNQAKNPICQALKPGGSTIDMLGNGDSDTQRFFSWKSDKRWEPVKMLQCRYDREECSIMVKSHCLFICENGNAFFSWEPALETLNSQVDVDDVQNKPLTFSTINSDFWA